MNEYRAYSQQYQMIAIQKQAIEARNAEMGETLKELDAAKGKVYYSTGAVLIESTKDDVKKRLEDQKKEAVDTLETLGKQEEKLKKRLEELQTKVRESEKNE